MKLSKNVELEHNALTNKSNIVHYYCADDFWSKIYTKRV